MVQSRILQQMVEHVSANAELGDADAVLSAIDQFVIDSGAAFMHIGEEKGVLVDQVIRRIEPRRVLELGTFFGYSAIRMARLLAPDSELITLEISPRDAGIANQLFEYAGLANCINLLPGDASESIKALSGEFDLVFFDHYAGNYFKDLQSIEQCRLVSSGSHLIADNVFIHEYDCARYLDHVRSGGAYQSQTSKTNCRHHGGSIDAIEISRRL